MVLLFSTGKCFQIMGVAVSPHMTLFMSDYKHMKHMKHIFFQTFKSYTMLPIFPLSLYKSKVIISTSFTPACYFRRYRHKVKVVVVVVVLRITLGTLDN